MVKEIFEKRKLEFKQYLLKEKRLPKVWEVRFADGEDLRLWFNKISKMAKFKDFVDEISIILNEFNLKILNDLEKEQEFLNCITMLNRIPFKGEAYFSDNDEMYMWYMSYKQKHKTFETQVHNSLREYQDFDLATIWPNIKQEFIEIIKQLRRIPNHGEAIMQNDIDVRTIYDKLESFEPEFVEKLLLHLQTYNKDALTFEERKNQLVETVSVLGYIPDLQEYRFSDGTDMFTWYIKYKVVFPNLENEINSLIWKKSQNKKVNIYLIPNFRKTGGRFYTICTNVGERLDLSQIESVEDALKADDTMVKRGGVILRNDEEIDTVSFKKGNS